jgi:hypothetical protein
MSFAVWAGVAADGAEEGVVHSTENIDFRFRILRSGMDCAITEKKMIYRKYYPIT